MLIGYARVSTVEQDLALQKDALTREGCTRTFEETASGAKADRPEAPVAGREFLGEGRGGSVARPMDKP